MNHDHFMVPPDKNIALNDYDEASGKLRKDVESLANVSLAPELDEVVRNGALALLPGNRFVILDFKMPSSLGLADS
jgi:hypothetical protein